MNRITRRRVPGWVDSCGQAQAETARADAGEQVEWGVAIPRMFQALASPSIPHAMPSAPRPGDPIWRSTAYWCPLVHLLIYSFGWTRPDRGLCWWYDAGKPTDDARLRLMADVWEADGQLDWFAAWLWMFPPFVAPVIAETTDIAVVERAIESADPRWLEDQRRTAENRGGHSPIVGGTDPLHLSFHWQGPFEAPTAPARLLRTGRQERSAVLVVDSMIGWHRALVEAGNDLPELGDRSWHVDVVARPVGWLGTYRLSRVTGRWFSGRHQLHMMGN